LAKTLPSHLVTIASRRCQDPRCLPLELSLSLVEEIPAIFVSHGPEHLRPRLDLLLAIGRHDTILERALPLVLDALYLVVRAENMVNLLVLLVSVVAGFVTR
jgi:hypothetical protein